MSQDVFRGTFLGGPSIEPSIDYGNGGFDIGLWSNFTVEDRVEGPSSTEVELYGSYSFTVVKDVASWGPGFTLYALPWAPDSGGSHKVSLEPNLGLDYTFAGVQLTPKAYYDLVLRYATLELNAAYTVPLARLHTELDLVGTLGAYQQAPGPPQPSTWSGYWLLGFSAPFKVTRSGTLTIGYSYTSGAQDTTRQYGGQPVTSLSNSGHGFVSVDYSLKL